MILKPKSVRSPTAIGRRRIIKFPKIKLDKAGAKILVINALAIAILLNLVANSANLGLDVTTNKIHSLSPATKNILSGLDDLVNIKVYLSEQIPDQLLPVKNSLTWFVQNYEKAGKGKIKVKFVDPNKDTEAQEEVDQLGIQPLEFSTVNNDKFEMSRGYLTVAVSYGDKNEVISALNDLPNLEYRLTAAIKKVLAEKNKIVGYSQGNEETDIQEITFAKKYLEENYQWEFVSLDQQNAKYNPQIDLLFINSPQTKIPKEAQLVIDQYLQHQKGVLILSEQYSVGANLMPSKIEQNLNEITSHYGISLGGGLVIDQSAAFAAFQTQSGGIIVPYPYWIKITSNGFNRETMPTLSLSSLMLAWASPLTLDQNAQWLIKSSSASQVETTVSSLAPNQKKTFDEKTNQEQVLAAAQTNPVNSLFLEEPKPEEKKKLGIEDWKKESPEGIRLAVVADADFIKDNFLRDNPGNLQFFLNLVDFLVQEKDLTSIRSKPVISRPLRPLPDEIKQVVKWGNIVLPLVLSMTGYLVVRYKRNAALRKKVNW